MSAAAATRRGAPTSAGSCRGRPRGSVLVFSSSVFFCSSSQRATAGAAFRRSWSRCAAVRKPVAGAPAFFCQAAIISRERGPKTPSLPRVSKPSDVRATCRRSRSALLQAQRLFRRFGLRLTLLRRPLALALLRLSACRLLALLPRLAPSSSACRRAAASASALARASASACCRSASALASASSACRLASASAAAFFAASSSAWRRAAASASALRCASSSAARWAAAACSCRPHQPAVAPRCRSSAGPAPLRPSAAPGAPVPVPLRPAAWPRLPLRPSAALPPPAAASRPPERPPCAARRAPVRAVRSKVERRRAAVVGAFA